MIKLFSKKKRIRVNTDGEHASGQASLSRSMADSAGNVAVPARVSGVKSKFALLIKRNAVGYAEERSKLQKEVAERQRVEQMALWREYLDYSVSKEKLYNYQSASSLILNTREADVTAVSTDPSRKSSKQIITFAQPHNNLDKKQDSQVVSRKQSMDSARHQGGMERKASINSVDLFELEEERLRQHEDGIARKNAAALLRLMSDPDAIDYEYLPSGHVRIVENPESTPSTSSTASSEQMSPIATTTSRDDAVPITPNSIDQMKPSEDNVIKPQPDPPSATIESAGSVQQIRTEIFEEGPRLFPAHLLSAPLPFQRQLFAETAPIQIPAFPYPVATPPAQTVTLPPKNPSVSSSSSVESTSSESQSSRELLSSSAILLQRTTSLKSKQSSDSSVRISNTVLRDSREFLDEFFAKALQLSNEALPPAPTASTDPLYERPVVEEPAAKELRLEVLATPPLESVQVSEHVRTTSDLRQVCSAQDLLLAHQAASSVSINPIPAANPCNRCSSSDALHFIQSQSVPVSSAQSPLSPRTVKGERIRELVSKFEQFAQLGK